jgi:transcriptional regulator with XRE-family HTH domain
MAALRDRAKALGLSQRRLADALGISTATLKRWFAGHGIALSDLFRLMEILEVDLSTLAALVPAELNRGFVYTAEQEALFLKHPSTLAYFDKLLAGETPESLRKKHGLTLRATQRYLRHLEEVQLIQRQLSAVRVLVKGEPRWRPGGKLAERFRRNAIGSFLEQAERRRDGISMSLHRLLPEDEARLREMLDEVRLFARGAERRADAVGLGGGPHGVLLGFAPFKWTLLEEIGEI